MTATAGSRPTIRNSLARDTVWLPRLDEGGELVERHPRAELVVGRGHAAGKPLEDEEQVGAAIGVSNRRDCDLTAQGGVRRLELMHLDDPLVRLQPYEAAVVRSKGASMAASLSRHGRARTGGSPLGRRRLMPRFPT